MERWVVVDTNLIFSSLIASSSSIRDTLLDESFQFHAPNFIIAELFKHKERLLRFSKLSEPELLELFNGITERIQFTPLDFISQKSAILLLPYAWMWMPKTPHLPRWPLN